MSYPPSSPPESTLTRGSCGLRASVSMLLLGASAPLATAQSVAQWNGTAGQPGPILVHPQAGAATPAVLAGFGDAELLDLDFAGRTRLESFLPDRPRREVEGPGVAKLVLPEARGSLFHYRRSEAGGDHFGFLWIPPDGAPRVVLERSAVAGLDPFVSRIAVAPDGSRMLSATVPAAGGDLFDVDLVSGATHERTTLQAPLDVAPESLGYGAGFLIAIASGSAWRAGLTPTAQAESLDFPGGTLDFEGGVVFSADRSTAATIAGPDPLQRAVYVLRASGPLVRAAGPMGAFTGSGAGLDSGPHLALNADGSVAAVRAATPTAREAWITSTDGIAVTPQILTGDLQFADTLDEIGLLRFVPGGGLQIAVGEGDAASPAGIDALDIYSVDLSGPAPAFTNLTLSSGDTNTPFLGSSSIDPEDGLFAIPGTDALLLHDGKGNRLMRVTVNSSTVLQGAVKQLDAVAWTGSRFLLSSLSDGATKRREIQRLSSTGGLELLFSLHKDVELPRLVSGPAEQVAARVVRPGFGELFVRLDAALGLATSLLPQLALYDTSFGFAADSTLLGSAAPSLLPGLFFGWPQSGAPQGYFAPPVGGVWMTAF